MKPFAFQRPRLPPNAPRYRYSYPLQAWQLTTDSPFWPAFAFPLGWGYPLSDVVPPHLDFFQ